MYERVLVSLDGSKAAEIALPYAEEIAAKLGAEIILATVSELSEEANHLYRSYLDLTAERVQRQLTQWEAGTKAWVKSEVLSGRPASELVQYAEENNISLITMASRARSGRGPWILGGIATKVIRATKKPVLLVRTEAADTALQERSLIKRILVPLDGSPLGERAIPYAEGLSRALGAEIVLLHAFSSANVEIVYDESRRPILSNKEEERLRASAMAYLDGVGKPLREKGLRISLVASQGPAPDEILEYAEANKIDLIAISTHGRSGISRWVMGSVTEKVLHAGDTAVLVVRAT